MSEESYRQRLHEAFRKGRRRDGTASMWKTGEGRDADGAEEVAAQVLRDVIVFARTSDRYQSAMLHAADIEQFAAERGIDLEETS